LRRMPVTGLTAGFARAPEPERMTCLCRSGRRRGSREVLGGARRAAFLLAEIGASPARSPRLRGSGGQAWGVATLVPGDRPLYALAAALVPVRERPPP
jgi:hypothetical protein